MCQHRGPNGAYVEDCDYDSETDTCRFNKKEKEEEKFMPCYRSGGCGPYEGLSRSECSARKPGYAERDKIFSAPIHETKEGDQYIEINGVRFGYRELMDKLGFMEIRSLKLCQKVPDGILTVSGDEGAYPSIDVEFIRPNDAVPSVITRVEQPMGEDDTPEALRAFLYDGRETYIAYTEPDVRPDEKSADDPRPITLVASGDPDLQVNVYRENPYVCFKGELR